MTRRSAATWLVGLAACLLNLHTSCPAHGQEVARVVTSDGVVRVERAQPAGSLRVVVDTPGGPVTLVFDAIGSPGPTDPLPPIDGPTPEPPGTDPEPEPDTPDTWPALAEHLLRGVPVEDRKQVAAAIVSGLDAVATPPEGAAPVTSGPSAAALLLDVATTYDFAPPPPKTASTILAIVRVGDVLVKAGDDAALAVRYAQELRKHMAEIANRG